MSNGLYALIGVVVGIVGTGAVEWVIGWVEDRRAARVAARLLYIELARNQGTIDATLGNDAWPDPRTIPNARVRRTAWDAHMAVLARSPDARVWSEVALAYIGLDGVAIAHEQAVGQSLTAEARDSLEHVGKNVARAIDALEGQAALRE